MKKTTCSDPGRTGFTLIELLVVVGLLGIVAVVGSNMFISLLRGSTKTRVLTEVKQNGDYAINVMGRMIRNARDISICELSMESLTIENPDEEITILDCSGSQISSNSASLISDRVELIGDSCSFDCTAGTTGVTPDTVAISFSLKQAGEADRPEEAASIDFQTQVTLRNLD